MRPDTEPDKHVIGLEGVRDASESRGRRNGSRLCCTTLMLIYYGRPSPGSSGMRRWRIKSSSAPWWNVFNAIYEEDFLGFSYGFRPKPG